MVERETTVKKKGVFLIQLKRETAEKLKKLKLAKRETYDEVINRILKSIKELKGGKI